jgi:hypothetical protein
LRNLYSLACSILVCQLRTLNLGLIGRGTMRKPDCIELEIRGISLASYEIGENSTSGTRVQVTAPSFSEGASNKSRIFLHSPCLLNDALPIISPSWCTDACSCYFLYDSIPKFTRKAYHAAEGACQLRLATARSYIALQ